MITYASIAFEIESLFSQRGLPTRVILNNPIGEAQYELVFPIGREADISEHIADANALLAERLQEPAATLTPRTVLFYFAYQLFAGTSLPDGIFRSVNVIDLQNPHKRKMKKRVAVPPIGKPLKMRAQWTADVLDYRLDVILIAPHRRAVVPLVPGLQEAVNVFNMDSDFLKVGSLNWGWSAARVVTSKPAVEAVHIVVDV